MNDFSTADPTLQQFRPPRLVRENLRARIEKYLQGEPTPKPQAILRSGVRLLRRQLSWATQHEDKPIDF